MVGTKTQVLPEDIQDYIHSLEARSQVLETRSQHLESQNRSLEKSRVNLERKVEILQEKLRLALYHRFGRSSEKMDSNQQELFEELDEIQATEPEEITIVSSHRRKKAGRKPLDPNIPREVVVHDIPEEEKICGCGAALSKIDEVVSEELEIIPEQVFVKRHVYPR